MLRCRYQNNPCAVMDCKFVKDEYLEPCGLFTFLSTIDEDVAFYPKEKELIEDLRADYVRAWNNNADSRAKGKATGTMFEKWIRKQIKQGSESGKVSFTFGDFAVDVAIPSVSVARVILEVKIYTDIQHTLALGGLLNCSPKSRNLGFVMFYEPDEREKRILNDFKRTYIDRFDYFIIQGGWSNTLHKLNSFL